MRRGKSTKPPGSAKISQRRSRGWGRVNWRIGRNLTAREPFRDGLQAGKWHIKPEQLPKKNFKPRRIITDDDTTLEITYFGKTPILPSKQRRLPPNLRNAGVKVHLFTVKIIE